VAPRNSGIRATPTSPSTAWRIEMPAPKALEALGDHSGLPQRRRLLAWKVSADPGSVRDQLGEGNQVTFVHSEDSTAAVRGTKSSIKVLVSCVERTTSERSRDGLQWKDNSRWQV
jgi:hypothetical protein